MICGNTDCEAYCVDYEENCRDTQIIRTEEPAQGLTEHYMFGPDLCSLFIEQKEAE